MDWYYTLNKQRRGPVDQKAFEQLVSRGEVTAETLVWRKGMPHWVPYSTLDSLPVPAPAPAPAPAVAQISTAPTGPACSRCGGAFASNDLVQLYGRSLCAKCKPVEVQVLGEGAPMDGGFETVRREHIRYEATIKLLGFLFLMGGAISMLFGLADLAGYWRASIAGFRSVGSIISLLLVPLAGAELWVGLGLLKLRPWARTPAIVLIIVLFLCFPFGVIIDAYFLYMVASKKGRTAFTDDYKQVIKETPHIKLQTSFVAWILLGLVLAFFGYLFYLQYRGSVTP